MHKLNLKPTHKPVQAYYQTLNQYSQLDIFHETAVKVAFQNLLESCAKQMSWTLILEWEIKRRQQRSVRVDGALVDSFRVPHGFWEAKDEHDDLGKEVRKKMVDTFELAEGEQRTLSFMNPENTQRVERQKQSPIFVIIGNPPYNANQVNENDNNKNRKYKTLDKRVSDTYAKDSKATLVNKLSDPYVKAIRWATDRIGDEGIVAFVTNNSFVDNLAFDGMRKHLAQDFDEIYVLDLGGNVRKNPKLSGTTHNVFGIQVGVSINIFVRKRRSD